MVDEEKGFVVAGLPIMLVSQSADAARFMVHEENKSLGCPGLHDLLVLSGTRT